MIAYSVRGSVVTRRNHLWPRSATSLQVDLMIFQINTHMIQVKRMYRASCANSIAMTPSSYNTSLLKQAQVSSGSQERSMSQNMAEDICTGAPWYLSCMLLRLFAWMDQLVYIHVAPQYYVKTTIWCMVLLSLLLSVVMTQITLGFIDWVQRRLWPIRPHQD